MTQIAKNLGWNVSGDATTDIMMRLPKIFNFADFDEHRDKIDKDIQGLFTTGLKDESFELHIDHDVHNNYIPTLIIIGKRGDGFNSKLKALRPIVFRHLWEWIKSVVTIPEVVEVYKPLANWQE